MLRLVGRYNYCFRGLVRLHASQCLLLYSTSASNNAFNNYLVRSLGFSHQQALSTSNRLYQYQKHCPKKVKDFKFEANANSVVTFFKTHGFDDTHIIKILSSEPRLLSSSVEKTLKPKLSEFEHLGFSRSDIVAVIYENPNILSNCSKSTIGLAVQILRQVLVCDTLVLASIKKMHWVNFSGIIENLLPNVSLLRSYGISVELIRKSLLQKPYCFLQNPETFQDKVIMVEKKLGIPPDSPMFLYGIHLVSGHSEENIVSKCRMFKSFGWTQYDVKTYVMKKTCCFTSSNESIRKKLNFLMNELQLEPAYLTTHHFLLTCSLEKRVVPRYKVLLMLKGKGLMKKHPSLYSAVKMSERCFLKRFVLPFKEVHDIYAQLTGCNTNMPMAIQASADNLS